MLKIRNKIFTFNKDEEVYMGHLSIWNKETEVHFYGAINRDYEEKLTVIWCSSIIKPFHPFHHCYM